MVIGRQSILELIWLVGFIHFTQSSFNSENNAIVFAIWRLVFLGATFLGSFGE